MSEEALAVQDGALPQQAGLGFGDYTLKPSRLELLQPTKAVELGVTPGVFRDSDSGQTFEKMQVVPLRIQPGRVYWPEGQGLKSKPLCRSRDAVKPVTGPDLVCQAQTCAKCRHSDWATFRTSGKKPLCQERWSFLFIDTESKLPYFMSVGGVSLKPIRNFRDTITKLYHIAKQKDIKLNIFDFTGEIVPKKIQNAKGYNYYELQFNNVGRIRNTGDEDFGVFFNQYVLRNQIAAEEDAIIEGEVEGTNDANESI